MQTTLVQLISNETTKTKLAILAFLYCGQYLKNSNGKQTSEQTVSGCVNLRLILEYSKMSTKQTKGGIQIEMNTEVPDKIF